MALILTESYLIGLVLPYGLDVWLSGETSLSASAEMKSIYASGGTW